MDRLTLFGLVAVTSMLVCYAFEGRSTWFILGFAVSCALGSAYGFLQGAWPFGVVEAIWSFVALGRWGRERARVAEGIAIERRRDVRHARTSDEGLAAGDEPLRRQRALLLGVIAARPEDNGSS